MLGTLAVDLAFRLSTQAPRQAHPNSRWVTIPEKATFQLSRSLTGHMQGCSWMLDCMLEIRTVYVIQTLSSNRLT